MSNDAPHPNRQRTNALEYRLLVHLCSQDADVHTTELFGIVSGRSEAEHNRIRTSLSRLARRGHIRHSHRNHYAATDTGRAHVKAVEARVLPGARSAPPAQILTGSLLHLMLAAADDTPRTRHELWTDRAGMTEAGIEVMPSDNGLYTACWRLANWGLLRRVGMTKSTTFVITEAGRAALVVCGPVPTKARRTMTRRSAPPRPPRSPSLMPRARALFEAFRGLHSAHLAYALDIDASEARLLLDRLTAQGVIRCTGKAYRNRYEATSPVLTPAGEDMLTRLPRPA